MSSDDHATIFGALSRWASEAGSRSAFSFHSPAEGSGDAATITFAGLRRRTEALAGHLQGLCRPGDRVLLLYPAGLEYIVGLLATMYAGAIAVPACLPQRRTGARVLGIAQDAAPALALTVAGAIERVERSLAGTAAGGITCVATDALDLDEAPAAVARFEPDRIAFLQYTSGSTGAPKGACVTHRALVQNQRMIRDAFGSTHDDRIVSWLPLYHDMGLVGAVFHALYMGIESVLMSPAHFLQRPGLWLETLSRQSATISGAPDFAFALCAERVTAEERARLDLSTWRIAFNGSERVRPDTMERFAAAFSSCGFRSTAFHPCYGLAEATLIVSGGRPRRATVPPTFCDETLRSGTWGLPRGVEQASFASCGAPVRDTHVRIVDPESRAVLPDGSIGEIWVDGPAISRGYWNSPVDPVFDGRLADQPEQVYLRTGDLGFLHEGELFPAGRLKDLIIVRGTNHFPEDLERTATESHPALIRGAAAAFAMENGPRQRVVIVLEVKRRFGAPIEAITRVVRDAIALEHQILVDTVVLIELGTLPRTSSGKTKRQEARAAYLGRRLRVIAEQDAASVRSVPEGLELPRDHDALSLAHWMARRVGHCLDGATIGIDDPLDRIGLDSLAAATVIHQLQEALVRPVPAHILFEAATLRDAARLIIARPDDDGAGSVPPTVAGAVHPLTAEQLSRWLLHEMAPSTDPHHLGTALHMTGAVDRDAVATAVRELVARHAALRTTFGDGPRQVVHDAGAAPLTVVDAAGWPDERLQQAMREACDVPIDLANGPVARFLLYSIAPDRHVLLILAHQIICDGWSIDVLHRDFARLYGATRAGISCGPAATPLAAYVRWQAQHIQSAEVQAQIAYWARQLAAVVTRERTADAAAGADAVRRGVTMPVGARVAALARDLAVSPFVVLVAALQAALAQVTSEPQIVFGTETANRPLYWMRPIVGPIANRLVLCGDVPRNATFAQLVAHARTAVADALCHQDVPFPWVALATRPPERFGRVPLFRLMFSYRNRALPVQYVDGVRIAPGEGPAGRGTCDTLLKLTNDGATISGSWQFAGDGADAASAEALALTFESVLDRGLQNPAGRVSGTLP